MCTSSARLLPALLILALSACVSTALVEKWQDPSYKGPTLHKVLVVGVQRDQGRRRIWEDAMVAALGRQGVPSEASYQVFPDQAPQPEQLNSIATRDGFDGVAATHFVSGRQHIASYPGAYPGWGWGPGWPAPYWGWGWGPWDSPGYIESDYRADYQTDVFVIDSAGGKLIWSGTTRSIDPSSTKNLTDEISRVLVPQLIRDGILPGGKH